MIRSNPNTPKQSKRRNALSERCRAVGKDFHKYLDKTPKVNSLTLILIRPAIQHYLTMLLNDIRKLVLDGVTDTINLTVDHYAERLTQATGLEIPTNLTEQLKRDMLIRFATETYYGSTFDGRIANYNKRAAYTLNQRLEFYSAMAKSISGKQLAEELYNLFIPQRLGLSLYSRAELLLVTEENRVYYETTLEFCRRFGIVYAKFCLTPEHVLSDICNDVANKVNNELIGKVEDPTGVYPLDTFPPYPHPRALNYIEPVFDYGFIPRF